MLPIIGEEMENEWRTTIEVEGYTMGVGGSIRLNLGPKVYSQNFTTLGEGHTPGARPEDARRTTWRTKVECNESDKFFLLIRKSYQVRQR